MARMMHAHRSLAVGLRRCSCYGGRFRAATSQLPFGPSLDSAAADATWGALLRVCCKAQALPACHTSRCLAELNALVRLGRTGVSVRATPSAVSSLQGMGMGICLAKVSSAIV